jgi:predicted transcriptional regulator
MAMIKRQNLKIELIKRGITQIELSKITNIPTPRLSNIITGTGYPSDEEKISIMSALGHKNTTCHDLFAINT